MTIKDLYTSLTGEKEADRYKKRNYIARGLIESDLAISLLAMGITRKVTDSIITEWWDKWHSFFQKEIWLQCCNEVANVGKVIDKGEGEDLRERFEDRSRRPNLEDK
ncbi:41194_t:CDS:2, partial [Gigaspora margarita]